MTRSLHLLVPSGWDDPTRPSGGNHYDRQVCQGLRDLGWEVVVHEVDGSWPRPTDADRAALAEVLAGLPGHATVLVDGLLGSPASDVLVPQADRLRLVPLVHLPLGDATADPVAADIAVSEHEVLESAAAVVTTSRWTRRRLLDRYGLWPGDVHVAEPGVDRAEPTRASEGGGRLACVAAVVAHKGHDTVLAAVERVHDLDWQLACVGPLDREPPWAEARQDQVRSSGLADRVAFHGSRSRPELGELYAKTDLVVVPSRAEAYGMVVTEALARGIPVLASDAGGLPEAMGRCSDGERPGLLVPVDDVEAWSSALREWLTAPELRQTLRARALDRRTGLHDWAWTAQRVSDVIERIG